MLKKLNRSQDINFLSMETHNMPFGYIFTNFSKKIIKHFRFRNVGKFIKCVLIGESFSNLDNKGFIQNSHLSVNLDGMKFNIWEIKEDFKILQKI